MFAVKDFNGSFLVNSNGEPVLFDTEEQANSFCLSQVFSVETEDKIFASAFLMNEIFMSVVLDNGDTARLYQDDAVQELYIRIRKNTGEVKFQPLAGLYPLRENVEVRVETRKVII